MRAEELKDLATEGRIEISFTKVVLLLTNIRQHLSVWLSAGVNPGDGLDESISILEETMRNDSGVQEKYKFILSELGLAQYFGAPLVDWIKALVAVGSSGLPIAVSTIGQIIDRLNEVSNAFSQISTSMDVLGVDSDEPAVGATSLGVLMPREAVANELGAFGKEVERIDRIYSLFSELETAERPQFQIDHIATTNIAIYVAATPAVAWSVLKVVEKILNIYKEILQIRKMRAELAATKIPEKFLKDLDEHASSVVASGLEEISKELFERHKKTIQPIRRSEIEKEISVVVSEIAARIDKGYMFDAKVGDEPSGDDDEAQETARRIEAIKGIRIQIAGFKSLPEPILMLTYQEVREE